MPGIGGGSGVLAGRWFCVVASGPLTAHGPCTCRGRSPRASASVPSPPPAARQVPPAKCPRSTTALSQGSSHWIPHVSSRAAVKGQGDQDQIHVAASPAPSVPAAPEVLALSSQPPSPAAVPFQPGWSPHALPLFELWSADNSHTGCLFGRSLKRPRVLIFGAEGVVLLSFFFSPKDCIS